MSVKIRLKRMGTKRRPYYRIVVMDSRAPRDGRTIDEVGLYHPIEAEDKQVVLKEEKMGTMDDMMHSIKCFLEDKGKLNDYINKEGVFKMPFELVFSWFRKAVVEFRKTQP